MIGSAVGKRYARALFDLAKEANAIEPIGKGLADFAKSWEESEELRRVFASPQFGLDQKKQLVAKLADRVGAHPLLKNALMLLSDRRRLTHVGEIAEAYAHIAERGAGKIRAEIVTATKLPDAYYAELVKTLEQTTGKKVVLVRREDPSLIGGVVTTVGGRVFDGSLKNRLRELRSKLLAGTDPASLSASE
jgi:F-type H+-transporting ATPase subunit delta